MNKITEVVKMSEETEKKSWMRRWYPTILCASVVLYLASLVYDVESVATKCSKNEVLVKYVLDQRGNKDCKIQLSELEGIISKVDMNSCAEVKNIEGRADDTVEFCLKGKNGREYKRLVSISAIEQYLKQDISKYIK